MADYTPKTGDTVTVNLTGKVSWVGDKCIEIEVPGQEDGQLVYRDHAEITKVAEPSPTKVGTLWRGPSGVLYFGTRSGWVSENGVNLDYCELRVEILTPVTLVE